MSNSSSNVKQQISRMVIAIGAKNKPALADYLNISYSAISKWPTLNKKTGEIRGVPSEHFYTIYNKEGVSLEWLKMGTGPKYPQNPEIKEMVDNESNYQSHTEREPTLNRGKLRLDQARVQLRLDQAEDIMLSNSPLSAILNDNIKKLYREWRRERWGDDTAHNCQNSGS